MKIHSSSLAFSPIGFNRQQVDKNNKARNTNADNELSIAKKALDKKKSDKSIVPAYSSAGIRQTLINPGSSLNEAKRDNINIIDTRTLRALTAYHQELNKPLQEQSAKLIQGIDIYA
ncbi:conserved hypothetical protein [Candidatus Methylobacter favarea]|uniref:Uncharacterized protein n=1 Tax=Candidatus Methylobacter favarea TaxID=2707345 RepID=A0A8S0Y8P8_9GAMM|nr:hypothetical protein [Candidatus Methylobacter favarea]CAA9888796.1 conserved hypothetical protein [Candidatus Methylobacter favarea]